MIRILLFLRAWHSELRMWKHGIRKLLKIDPHLNDEEMGVMRIGVTRKWIDFERGTTAE